MMPVVLVVSDTGSSSSEDEAPKRPAPGAAARNGEVRRRRSRTPSPRRRHRDPSPRSGIKQHIGHFLECICDTVISLSQWIGFFVP